MTMEVHHYLSQRAREYFGGDVQAFWIERSGSKAPFRYDLYQRPHWLPVRIAATTYARSSDRARRDFEMMAYTADLDHA